ncbi:Exodeoxyribonuclease [bioreactor metagenome]|uniref:Exodeoxyribonuclease n=1 Tax=bioreactor metagenome TaxID=1076179 RepID=A0A645DQ51_9ZZZZ
MRIITWNVNGYRAVLKKDFKESIAQLDPDILCLQEIKAKPEQLKEEELNIPGYQAIWNSAERPGYSGVASYLRKDLLDHRKGLGVDEFDVEGRVIQLDLGDFVLFNIYFPNGQRGQERVDYKLRFYAELLNICDELHKKGRNVVITGDFNTAHNEIDLANPKENAETSGFLPEERVWIDHFLEHGFVDAFRELYPDKVQYSWWTYRVNARARGIGWRLDYYLVSKAFMPKVTDVTIHDQVMGSDHCPVSLELAL